MILDRTIVAMAGLRLISSLLEAVAAVAILHIHDVRSALRINAALGLVGPTVLILVTIVGLHSLAGELSPGRIALILGGIVLILAGTR